MYSPLLDPLIVSGLYHLKQSVQLPITTLSELIIADAISRYGTPEAKQYIRQYLNVNQTTHTQAKRKLTQRNKYRAWKRNRRNKSKHKEKTHEESTDEQHTVSLPTGTGLDRGQAA